MTSLLAVVTVIGAMPANAVSEEAIQRELVCRCGCGNMPIRDCECSNAQKVRAEIRRKIKEGLSERQILDYFIRRYGEEIVGAPAPWKGFNLVAWVFPFLAILAGGLIFRATVGRWKTSGFSHSDGVSVPLEPFRDGQLSHSLEEQLDKELRDFEQWNT